MAKTLPSNLKVYTFIICLSFVCALVLSVLATALKEPQESAKDLDRSKQMMIAARILNPKGYWQIEKEPGVYEPAKLSQDGLLVSSEEQHFPSRDEVLSLYRKRLIPKLVDSEGNKKTFEEAGLDLTKYVSEHKKKGYQKQPLKLIYEILPNSAGENEAPVGYVIPVNGFGLWDAIYGYIAIAPNGISVIGISWYEQKETPGLGANITEEAWQKQFFGKKIFQASPSGEIDVNTSEIGIAVVRGRVIEVIGEQPKADSAVDGMAGATLTGTGVTKAYKEVLTPYRPFFVKLNQEASNE